MPRFANNNLSQECFRNSLVVISQFRESHEAGDDTKDLYSAFTSKLMSSLRRNKPLSKALLVYMETRLNRRKC